MGGTVFAMTQHITIVGLLLTCLAVPSYAQHASGFALSEFARNTRLPLSIEGKQFGRKVKPKLLRLTCRNCRGYQNVDIVLSKSPDGNEARFRSGERTIAMMESECKARNPSCTYEAVSINGAIGWISRQQIGRITFDVSVLYKNGDQLDIQSLSDSAADARANGSAVREQIAPLIIGPN
jgi:hypothetical protein